MSADDEGDAHLDVIADHHVVVEWRTVRAQQREVLDVGVASFLYAVDGVLEARRAFIRRDLETYRERLTSRGTLPGLVRAQVPAELIAQPRALAGLGLPAL